MESALIIFTVVYLVGAVMWFVIYYSEWDSQRHPRYGKADERKYFARQLLATPLWPAALFRNAMIIIGMVKEDANEER